MATVKPAVSGLAFDVDYELSSAQYAAFKSAGYDTAIRYIPRTSALIKGNLSLAEVGIILSAGLSLSAVQHVSSPGWSPSAALGTQYGKYAGQYAAEIGLPAGMNIWLDLESPAPSATAQDCIDYANAWFEEVSAAGYLPGIYCGWGIPLTPAQLHTDLKFSRYWRAYNGPDVATRGYCIIQHTAKTLNGINFDPNTIQADNNGDLPTLLFP